jgi:hypothetical protein
VAGIAAGKRYEDGSTEIRITYRFGPPPGDGQPEEEDSSVGTLINGRGFRTPATTVPTLTVVAVK